MGYYVKFERPLLDNLTFALDISRKFFDDPQLLHHRRVLKREMSPLYQLYFNIVHKMIIPRKERRAKANFLDLSLMELLDTKAKIDLSTLIIKHMYRFLLKDDKGHSLPYVF